MRANHDDVVLLTSAGHVRDDVQAIAVCPFGRRGDLYFHLDRNFLFEKARYSVVVLYSQGDVWDGYWFVRLERASRFAKHGPIGSVVTGNDHGQGALVR